MTRVPGKPSGARRGSLALAAALAIGVWPSLGPGTARAAERPFPTLVALGFAQPIETREGLYTPIVVADHESPGWYGAGRLNASIYTSTLSAGMTHPVAGWLDLGYAARLRVTTEGDSADVYREGNRDSGAEFAGNSLAAIGTATAFPRAPWRAALELERMETRFSRVPNTRRSEPLPEDFSQNEARLALSRHGLLGEPGAETSLTGAFGAREGWDGWALDPEPQDARDYTKAMLHALQPIGWAESSRGKAEGWLLTGQGLDLFSGYAVGGLTGRHPVGGYFRNEVRARQAAIVNLEHERRFSEDRRLSLFAHGARAETLEGAAFGGSEWVSLASVGIGVYYGIRALHGLPVIVRYAEGLFIPAGSREGHRREILLLLAAGF